MSVGAYRATASWNPRPRRPTAAATTAKIAASGTTNPIIMSVRRPVCGSDAQWRWIHWARSVNRIVSANPSKSTIASRRTNIAAPPGRSGGRATCPR
jgi:hypothetical protein